MPAYAYVGAGVSVGKTVTHFCQLPYLTFFRFKNNFGLFCVAAFYMVKQENLIGKFAEGNKEDRKK